MNQDSNSRKQHSPIELAHSHGLSTGNCRAERADRLTRCAGIIPPSTDRRQQRPRAVSWRGRLSWPADAISPDTPFFEAIAAAYLLAAADAP